MTREMIKCNGFINGRSSSLALSFVVACVLVVAYSVGGTEYCSHSQFSCVNGNCIPAQWKCDEEDDCHDNSDENQCGPRICNIPQEFRCSNGHCIPSKWHCDGEADCADGSDEGVDSCGAVECLPGHFSCGAQGTCIPLSWICDGHEDCQAGLDESLAVCGNGTCAADEFMCHKSRLCIASRWVCDLDNDCEDGSDEVGCEPVACTGAQWQCQNMHCISNLWRCDGDTDCQDGSDEHNCSSITGLLKPCEETEFACDLNNECIHEAWRCDGDDDCADGSDEKNCGERTCSSLEFQCAITGSCILRQFECDGIAQCHDGSDERNCQNEILCDSRLTFDCSQGEKSNCIDIGLVCNGRNDCGANEDESSSLCANRTNPCGLNNGGCSHECIFTRVGFHCNCPEGYAIHSDQRTCKDIDECQILGTCSQICENRKGGYKCSCSGGYEWDVVDKTCRATGELPFMLIATRHDIRKIGLYSGGGYHLVIDGLKSAVALDYDFEERHLFWTDISMETINMIKLTNDSQVNMSVVVHHDISTPDGLAFDWIHKNLYWTDTGENCISVLTMANDVRRLRKTLISTNLDEPRAIVVDPRPDQRYMYWTDWGNDAKIERAFLDGSQRKKVIYRDLQWPNGLTIDYESNLLFWIDAKTQTLSRCNLNGQDRHTVISGGQYLRHPFAASVFEDFVFWTDWLSGSVLKVNKFSGFRRSLVRPIVTDLRSPMDLRIFHQLKQPKGTNYCFNSGCSHICLPGGSVNGYSCLCPDHENTSFYLAADGKTCHLHEIAISAQYNEYNATTSKMKVDATDFDISKENNLSSSNRLDAVKGDVPKSGRSSGQIAGAVITVLFLVSIALLIVCIALYRCHAKRSFKTMNFDNPVYRKTAKEQQSLEGNINYCPALPPTLEPLTFAISEHV